MGLFSLADAYIHTDCPRELHLRYEEKHKSITLFTSSFFLICLQTLDLGSFLKTTGLSTKKPTVCKLIFPSIRFTYRDTGLSHGVEAIDKSVHKIYWSYLICFRGKADPL